MVEEPGYGSVRISAADQRKLEVHARQIIAGNRYLTLATADASGLPWSSPVYFTPDGERRFLWVSSPHSRHSQNIAARPEVALTLFDSTVPVGQGAAVYCAARAGLVADAELEASAAVFAAGLGALSGYGADDLRPPAPLRLYEAVVAETSVLLRGADPRNLGGSDARVVVRLGEPR